MYALRRTMKRSQYRSMRGPAQRPGAAGLRRRPPARCGATWTWWRTSNCAATWPVQPLLTAGAILERIGEVEPGIAAARQAEQLSNRHWVLAYLARQPRLARPRRAGGPAGGNSGMFIIPDLALETQARLPADLPLDSEATLVLRAVDLARQDARSGGAVMHGTSRSCGRRSRRMRP